MTRAVGVAVVLAFGVTALSAQDDPPVFRATASGVRVDVAVTERGRPVTGLGLTDFAILDSGVAQQAVSLSVGKLPIDVTIALDVSGSVQGPGLRDLRRAVDQVRERLGSDDRLKLLTFSDRIQRLADFTDPKVDTNRVFGEIVPAGGTAIFDTLAVALSSKTSSDRRQLVMLFSDGVDTLSVIDPETLIDVAQRSTPMLAFVLSGPMPIDLGARAGLGGNPAFITTPASTSPDRLVAVLAAETGGVVIYSAVAAEVASRFNQVLDNFRAAYVLHYTPTGVPEKGFHPLTVSVTRRGQYDIRARRGYMSE